jgi:hypothetical protein
MNSCSSEKNIVLTRSITWQMMWGEERSRIESVIITRDPHHECDSRDLHLHAGIDQLSKQHWDNLFRNIAIAHPKFFTCFIDVTYSYELSGELSLSEFGNLSASLVRRVKMDKQSTEDFSDFVGKQEVHYLEDAECQDKNCLLCFPDGVQSYAENFDVFPDGWVEITAVMNASPRYPEKYYSESLLPLQDCDDYILEPDWDSEDLISIQGPEFAGGLATVNYLDLFRGGPGELIIQIRDAHDFRLIRIKSKSYGQSVRYFFNDILSERISLNQDIFPVRFLKSSIKSMQKKLEVCDGDFEYVRSSIGKEFSLETYLEKRIVTSYRLGANRR